MYMHLLDVMKYVKILINNIFCKLQSLNIFYRTSDVTSDDKKPAVLFLHGAASSSEIWQQLGSLQLVGALGFKPIAIDLPGMKTVTISFVVN